MYVSDLVEVDELGIEDAVERLDGSEDFLWDVVVDREHHRGSVDGIVAVAIAAGNHHAVRAPVIGDRPVGAREHLLTERRAAFADRFIQPLLAEARNLGLGPDDLARLVAHLADIAPQVTVAVQEQQNGTGDAVRAGLEYLADVEGEIVVTYGDVPLLTGETLAALVAAHRTHSDAVTVLSTVLDDPSGYGRIVRDADGGQVAAIVEQKDATAAQAAITEINAGIYVFDAQTLREGLASLTTDNAQGELYLTDVIAFARSRAGRVGGTVLTDSLQAEGVNDRVQLATLSAELNRRILRRWMIEGVTVLDPATTWVHDSVDLAADVTLLPGTSLEGATSVATGAVIGPDTTLRDVEVGENAHVIRTHGELSVINADAEVGPFARLRPGTVLGAHGKIGTSTVQSRATAGLAGRTFIFVLPGSPGACRDAWDGIGIRPATKT